jgi:predicted 3-demethylubiquinone-9 3-methyltransferase (glyoxalase superfamily)
VDGILKFEKNEGDQAGKVKHAQFKLMGQKFMIMESNADHQFDFNEAISIIVNCTTQKEIDFYWNKLSEDGEEGQCGWLKDKFGVSWQVESLRLVEMLKDPDKRKTERVTAAFLKMKKFNVAELEKVYN